MTNLISLKVTNVGDGVVRFDAAVPANARNEYFDFRGVRWTLVTNGAYAARGEWLPEGSVLEICLDEEDVPLRMTLVVPDAEAAGVVVSGFKPGYGDVRWTVGFKPVVKYNGKKVDDAYVRAAAYAGMATPSPKLRPLVDSPYVDVEDGEVSLEAMKGHMEKLEAMWKSMGGSFIGWDHTSGRQTMLAFFGHPRLQRPSRETLNVHEVRDSYKHRPICSVALAHIMAIPEPCILGAAQLSRGPLSGGAWSGVCRGIRPAGER